MLQGCIASSWSTWGPPEPHGPFLQTCFPAGRTPVCTAAWGYSSPGTGFCISPWDSFIWFLSAKFSSLLRCLWMDHNHLHNHLVYQPLLPVCIICRLAECVLCPRSLMKILRSIGPSIDHWGTSLVICLQLDFMLLMATLWAPPLKLMRHWYKFLDGSKSFKSCYFIHFPIMFQTKEFHSISLFYLFYLKRWNTKKTAQWFSSSLFAFRNHHQCKTMKPVIQVALLLLWTCVTDGEHHWALPFSSSCQELSKLAAVLHPGHFLLCAWMSAAKQNPLEEFMGILLSAGCRLALKPSRRTRLANKYLFVSKSMKDSLSVQRD